MMSRHATREGFSIIELLVVVSIIALIAGISIPLMSRLGLFSSSRVDLGARDIFSTMRAAKIYAASNNVQAGIAYAVKRVEDSSTSLFVPVIDAFAPVRKLSIQELNDHDGFLRRLIPELDASVDPKNVYVTIETRQGVFRPLPNGTSVSLLDINGDPYTSQSDLEEDTGLSEIVILDLVEPGFESTKFADYLEASTIFEARIDRGLPVPFDTLVLFPAHIFNPSGSVDSSSTKQRITLSVMPFPDRPEDERTVFIDDVATPIKTDIFLYTATGRVKVSG